MTVQKEETKPTEICRICGEPGTPGEHGGNCEEKDQVLRDFEQERA